MLDRPALDDATILAGLREGFGLDVDRISFDPLGNDSAAWTYRAGTSAGDAWFIKVRRRPTTRRHPGAAAASATAA